MAICNRRIGLLQTMITAWRLKKHRKRIISSRERPKRIRQNEPHLIGFHGYDNRYVTAVLGE